MSSAETQNITTRRPERVIFGVAIEEVYSPLPLSLFLPDSLRLKNNHCSYPIADLLPLGLFPIYLCIANPPFKVHCFARHSLSLPLADHPNASRYFCLLMARATKRDHYQSKASQSTFRAPSITRWFAGSV
jgi:hypothetical protein